MLKLLIATTLLMFPVIAHIRAEEVQGKQTPAPEIKASADDLAQLEKDPVPETVTVIIDPLTFVGKSGKIYQLSGLDSPGLLEGDPTLALAAQKRLSDLLVGKDVKLFQTKKETIGRLNRLGHHLVQAVKVQDQIWIQGQLLSEGLVRVRTTASNPEMAAAMLATEQTARSKKIGLWGQTPYRIRADDDTEDSLNSFQLVEGTVKKTAIKTNTIFVNFGEDWQTDFTIGIPSPARKLLARKNIDPLQLTGRHLRVRGWVRHYNGPYIEIDHAEQIELLDDAHPPTSALSEENPAPSEITSPNIGSSIGMKTIRRPQKPQVNDPEPPQSPPTPSSAAIKDEPAHTKP